MKPAWYWCWLFNCKHNQSQLQLRQQPLPFRERVGGEDAVAQALGGGAVKSIAAQQLFGQLQDIEVVFFVVTQRPAAAQKSACIFEVGG